jgi:hypothetical protein
MWFEVKIERTRSPVRRCSREQNEQVSLQEIKLSNSKYRFQKKIVQVLVPKKLAKESCISRAAAWGSGNSQQSLKQD